MAVGRLRRRVVVEHHEEHHVTSGGGSSESKQVIFETCAGPQCDQMARSFFQYLAVDNKENLPNCINVRQSRFKMLQKTK